MKLKMNILNRGEPIHKGGTGMVEIDLPEQEEELVNFLGQFSAIEAKYIVRNGGDAGNRKLEELAAGLVYGNVLSLAAQAVMHGGMVESPKLENSTTTLRLDGGVAEPGDLPDFATVAYIMAVGRWATPAIELHHPGGMFGGSVTVWATKVGLPPKKTNLLSMTSRQHPLRPLFKVGGYIPADLKLTAASMASGFDPEAAHDVDHHVIKKLVADGWRLIIDPRLAEPAAEWYDRLK